MINWKLSKNLLIKKMLKRKMLLKLMKQKGFISEIDCYSHVERGYQKRRTFWDGTNQIVFSEK